MSIHRFLKTLSVSLLCALALSSCSASDSDGEESIATEQQDLSATWFGTLPGWGSKNTVMTSRGLGKLDVFRTVSGSVIFNRYTHTTGYDPPVNLGKPSGVTLASLAVTTNLQDAASNPRIDLFAAATNGAVYHKSSNTTFGVPTWSDWTLMNGITVKAPTVDAITVTSYGQRQLDLFWVTPAGNIGHTWAVNNAWVAIETGDNSGPAHLRMPNGTVLSPPIESVSIRSNRVDVVVGFPGPKAHLTWDNGWTGPTPMVCCQVGSLVAFGLHDFVLMKASSTSFELFGLRRAGVPADTEVLRFTYTIPSGSAGHSSGWPKTSSGRMAPTDWVFTNAGGSARIGDPNQTVDINQGLRWDQTRRDIMGWMATVPSGNLMWQMYIL